MAAKHAVEEQETTTAKKPEDLLAKTFVDRAWEVYGAAKSQYPTIMEQVTRELALLIEDGRLKGPITGEQLMGLLRAIGLNVRLETKIRVLESGELKPLAEKLKGR
jgi:DNA-binding TFAR19-related protein (PDSD5 family)